MEPVTYNLIFQQTAPQTIKECIEYFSTYVFKEINAILISSKLYSEDTLSEIKKNYFIAGGAVSAYLTNQKIRDIDIYCSDVETCRKIQTAFKLHNAAPVISTSKNSEKFRTTLPYSLDLIYTTFGSPQEILASFDFTVCCGLVKHNGFYHHPNYFYDLNNKNLLFNNTNQGLQTLRRIIKYTRKGYQISAETMLQAIKIIKGAELNEEITKTFLEAGNRKLKDFHNFQCSNGDTSTSNLIKDLEIPF